MWLRVDADTLERYGTDPGVVGCGVADDSEMETF